jgi:hypothetical protein
MNNIKKTSSDEAVIKKHGRGTKVLKFVADDFRMWQPCDVGEGFEAMKAACKKSRVKLDHAASEQSVKQ